jgi:hypothetical protein
VTSNKSFVDWGEVFNDQILATAILDRLLHDATTVNIKGDTGCARRRRPACSGASPSRPVTSRRWEPRRNPEDTNVGEQGTSYFGVFRTTNVGLTARRTQLWMAWAEGSNWPANSSGGRPFRTKSLMRCGHSGGYGRGPFHRGRCFPPKPWGVHQSGRRRALLEANATRVRWHYANAGGRR